MMWDETLLPCLLLIWFLTGSFVGAATLDGCYSIDRTSNAFTISPGRYDPSSLDHAACIEACAYQEYSYASLRAGQFCMCSDTNYLPAAKKADNSLCNTPCTGDNLITCGHDNYALVYHITDTRALIQLDDAVTYVVGTSASVSPSSVSGSDLEYSYDFGDGTAATNSSDHTYTAPGEYSVVVTVHNDKWVDFDAFAHSVNTQLSGVAVTCPEGAGVAQDFECTVEILHGNDLYVTPTFGSGAEAVTGPVLPAGSPTYSHIGHVSQYPDPSLPSNDVHGAATLIFWVFPGSEVQQASKLVAIEAAIASVGDGTLHFVIYKPVCTSPSDVFCPIENSCMAASACSYDFTLTTHPTQQDTCTTVLDNYCLYGSRCVDSNDVNTCPAKPTRYEMDPTGNPRAEYEVVEIIARNVASTGYYHDTLATPVDMQMGYVLGVKMRSTGAQISYESTPSGNPVEFQYAGTDYAVGQALPVASKTSGHQIRHLARFTLVQPVEVMITHAFAVPDFYDVTVNVSGSLGGPVEEKTVILIQEIITGLEVEVDTDILRVGGTVTASAKISGGAMVNYTWDWDDGNEDTTIRQATNFNESDVQTHTYITDGTFALTVTAYNFANNETATVTMYVQYPINKDHFMVTSDSPKPHPGDIIFTLTITLPPGEDFGTDPQFSSSITFYENSTETPISIDSDGQSEPFAENVRFSGEYQAIVSINNKISSEYYKLPIVMVEPITGFYVDAMYQPPLPLDGPVKMGFGPTNNVFPLDSPVVFVPRFATGTRMSYNIDYDDGTPLDTVTEETIPYRYTAVGPYLVRVDASNDLPGLASDTVTVILQENIAGIQIMDLQATTANETKEFDISVASLGTTSCLVIDYGDTTQEIFGNQVPCENHADYPGATWVQPLTNSFRTSHIYTSLGSYHMTAFGFNLVSDASTDLFFAVSDLSCNSPQLFIRDGHPDWRGPRVAYFNQDMQIQGITDVKCKSYENMKVWDLQAVDPNTGLAVPGTAVKLTGLPPSHRFYLPDADTAEIYIPPRTIPVGTWKFKYTVHMDQVSDDNIDYVAFANEYVQVRAAALKIQIFEGQTTSKVVGHGSSLKLQPGVLSRDPDLPDDVTDQNFTSIEYFCRRFYEPWELNDQREIDKTKKIVIGGTNTDGVDKGGCFGTGSGLLDYEDDVLDLDTTNTLPNMTYEIMVVVTKGSRVGDAAVQFTVKPGNPPQSSISCSGGTLFEAAYASLVVNPTDDFRLKAGCESGCSGAVYQWEMDYLDENDTLMTVEGWEQHATGVTTESLFIAKDVFTIQPDVHRYLFTIHITNEYDQSGKAHMRVILNEPPEGGFCTITPPEVTTDDKVDITCSDWEDDHGVSKYEFFVQVHGQSVNKVVGFGSLPTAQFYPPLGKAEDDYRVTFGVQIDDVLGATTIRTIGTIIVRPTNISASEFLSEENTVEAEKRFKTLAAEGNSRAINNVILKESSRLNDIRSTGVQALNGTNATAEEDSSDDDVTDPRLYEAGRTKRAYWRKNMADLQTETSLDSLGDVLYSASAATVLTEATDELSHDALSSMTRLGDKMVGTLERTAQDTDQKTVVKTASAMFETFTNMLEGSAKTIEDPLWLLDQYEEDGSSAGFSSLHNDIERELGQSEEESYLTTEDTVSQELKAEKERKARAIVAKTNMLITQVADIMKQNKLPREPASKFQTKTGSMTVSRTEASTAVNQAMKEGKGTFNLPSWCAVRGQADCEEDEIVDVQTNSFQTNHYNYMNSSHRISDKSNVLALKFEDKNGQEIDISNAKEEIEIWIPRPNTETPQCNSFAQNFNTTSQSGMSMHSFYIPFDQTVATLQVIPEEFFSIQYGLLLRYLHPPNREEYDHMWIMPPNISVGANVSDYTIYLNEAYISNNTGTYYLGIVEIPQAPQGDLPDTLFDDNLSPQELLDDILKMHRAFNFTGNYTLCVYISGCAYFNNKTQEWSTDGVRVGPKTTKDLTQCFSRHLTDFASTWLVPPTPLDFQYIFNNAGFLENLTIYITTIVIYVLFVFIFIWARRKDRKDIIMQGLAPMADNKPKHKYLYEIAVMTGQWKGSGTSSKVHFILSGEDDETEVRTFEDDKRPILQTGCVDRFVMAVPKPLGPLNYMRVWHDNSGKGSGQNWFVAYIAVRDLQTRQRYYFIANRWFSLVDDDGQVDRLLPVASREQMQGFSHVFSTHTRKNLNDGHLWFSIFLRPAGSRFTRVQRTACCLMALWLEMLVNIMWYKVIPPTPSSSAINVGPFSMSPAQISIGIQSSLIVFPITLLVVQIFRKVRPRQRQKSHRRIIKEQQEELKKKYRVGKEDAISQSHVTIENSSPNVDDTISTRSKANLLDNQTDNAPTDDPTVLIKTTASNPAQKTSRKKKQKFSFPWWVVIIGWCICLTSIATASIFTVFYGIQFGDQTTKEWLTSLVVTFITGILCTQPIKILLVAVFVALIIKSPNADEEDGIDEEEDDPELGKDEMWLHDLSSPSQGKTAYKPPDPANLERIRVQRIKELKMYNILREICFYIIFLWTLMVFSYSSIDPFAFYMKDQYVNTLNNADGVNTFDKVTGVKSFWRWVDAGLVPNIYAGKWYNGQMDPYQAGFFGDRQSYILGKVVMRQVRVKEGLCEVHEELEETIAECNEAYSFSNEDTVDYGRAWRDVNDTDETAESYRYTSASDLDGYPFLGIHALYGGGGYVVLVDGSQSQMRAKFRQLYNETWVDKYTRAVFIEFSCYNPQVNLFAVVNLVTEFLQTGAGQPMHRVDIIRLLTYSEGFGLVRIICEVMFFCFILFFIVKEVRNARREKRQYLKNFWNWVECAIIGFSIGSAIIYFYRMYITNGILDTLKEGAYRYIKLQYVAYWNELLGYMLGWIVFLATLKFLKLLRFNRRIGILSSTIRNCSTDLMYFGIMFGIVFFAFATAFYLIFSSTVYDYSDFIFTCESLMSSILGKFRFGELVIAESMLGPFFFFSFMTSMSYILINMFLTIINEAFKVVNADISKQSNEYEMVDFMIRRLKLWTGIGKPPVTGGDKKPGEGEDQEDGPKKEPDIVDEFPEKVDQLLNSIAKIYFNHETFDEVIRGMGQKGKKGKKPKKTISV
ncbi:uncharacterized protein LOC119737688 [Patiria miniata]|uniref:Uncharacterized protein n=1 Tax=Patiria miniata TaxID=46514 RepID=A0A914AWS9_PATMI|nr:uncharacterized protein LOC119737688 [Patiria miniata]